MKIAIAIETSNDNKEIIASHFGGSDSLIILEIDKDKNIINQKIIENPFKGHHGGMCKLPQYLKQFEISVIIAGGMGQKAIQLFEQDNIEVITAPGLMVEEILPKYLKGELKGYTKCEEHHHNC